MYITEGSALDQPATRVAFVLPGEGFAGNKVRTMALRPEKFSQRGKFRSRYVMIEGDFYKLNP